MTALPTSLPVEAFDRPYLIEDVSWELYELMLRDLSHRNIRLTYDRGRLVLMAPRPSHEGYKRIIGRLIEALTEELKIPVASFSSTTWKREDLLRGLESDECYYIQSYQAIRGRLDINLPADPPPDLAVEVDITHFPIDRPSIYAALGVPEIWWMSGRRLGALLLNDEGNYEPSANSLAFPKLQIQDVERFVLMLPEKDETTIVRAWRDWIRASGYAKQ